ncbi:MAG: YeeE/YedE family protein [Chloroflexia bacterium]|nr:YeeE/YedE family protein [Chloroflexia bacterium]
MLDILPFPLPWFVVGPLMGFTVAGLYALANLHLGVSGAYVQIVDAVRGRPTGARRLRFLGGTFAGTAVVAVLGTSPQAGWGYGRLGELLSPSALAVVLFAGGVLVGFGARWAGDCTSGHGLTGCSTRSPGSLLAVASFMVSAIAITWLLRLWAGGAL